MMKSCTTIIICILLSSCSQHDRKVTSSIRNPDTVLVLGSGGARAIAHLGVLEVLEKNNIPIDLIIGTSGGSIIGALYADQPNYQIVKEKIFKCNKSDIINFSLLSAISGISGIHRSIIDGANGEKFLKQNMHAQNFNELKIPLIVLATNVITGKVVLLNQGSISRSVRASYSIPGLFPPVKMGDMILVDGGVAAPLGTAIAKSLNPRVIIAVDITLPIEHSNVKNMLDLTYKCLNITYNTLNEKLSSDADILIRPELGDAGIFDDHKRDMLYQSGVDATIALLPEIKKRIKQHTR